MIKRIKYCFLVSALLLLAFSASAQYYSNGQNPASLKWKQIRTEHYRIIYPEGYEARSQYLANAMEHVYGPMGKTLESTPGKMPIILHNQSVYSNAMVAYAPKRMEFYTMMPQDTYAQDWLDQLVLHEGRHAVHYQKTKQGFTKVLYYIFGEQAVAAMLGLFTPFWFIEGDATLTETAFSKTGRGRLPSFEMKLRAQFLEKGIYNYDKAYNGSYKDFTANWYELGYQMVSLSRKKYGADLYSKTQKRVARWPFTLVPFSHSLAKNAGKGKVKLYRENSDELLESWQTQEAQEKYTDYHVITQKTKHFTSYRNAVFLNDSCIAAEKTGINDIARYVKINLKSGKEKRLFTPGTNYFSNTLSGNANKICWGDRTFDPRWEQRDYGVIRVYDYQKKKLKQITHRSRYFAPSISGDGLRIVAAEVSHKDEYSLLILDAQSGDILQRISTPENLFFINPFWSADNQKIVSIVLGDAGKSIAIVDGNTGEVNLIMPFTYQDISRPKFFKNYILFTGSWSGIDNIYAIDIENGEIHQLTSSRFGATDAIVSPDEKTLIYSNYTADGYELAQMPIDPASWIPLQNVENHSMKLYETMAEQEDFLFKKEDVPDSSYTPKKYRKGLNLFNFHSWAPVSFDIDNMTFNPGVMVMSQNLMSSSLFVAGFEYNLNEDAGKVYLNYTYAGQYPVIDLKFDYGLRRSNYTDKEGVVRPFNFWETNLKAHLSVPLRFYTNKYYKGITPLVGSSMVFLRMEKDSPVQFIRDRLYTMDYQFYAYNLLKTSMRDLQSKWGQTLSLTYRDTPFTPDDLNSIFAASAILYFPGIGRHHGFRLYAGYQKRGGKYKFSDLISYPRGFTSMHEDDAISFKIDYVLPLFYPDWRIGPLMYFKRFKSRLFFDYAIGTTDDTDNYYKSVGIDLTSDIHFFGFFAPFDLGVRAIYKPDFNTVEFEFLFKFSLASF